MNYDFDQELVLEWLVPAGIMLLVLFGVLALRVYYPTQFLLSLERQTEDMRAQYTQGAPVDDRLVYIAIDQPAYETGEGARISEEELESSEPLQHMTDNFPWDRSVWGHAIDKLISEGGAEVVVVDLLLETPSWGDEYLKKMLDKYKDSVVIGARYNIEQRERFNQKSVDYPTESLLDDPREETLSKDGRVGHVNIFPSPIDGVVRDMAYQLPVSMGENVVPALSLQAVRKYGADVDPPSPGKNQLIHFSGPPGTFSPRPIYQIFVDDLWERNFLEKDRLEDAIVMIGPYGVWQQDYHSTPMAQQDMPGPEVHLNAISALLHDAFLERVSANWTIALIVVLGLIAGIIFLLFDSLILNFLLILAIAAGYVGVATYFYGYHSLILPIVFPMIAYGGSGLGVFGYQFVRQQREKMKIRGTLDRYLSRDVASELLENKSEYYEALGGKRKKATVLFSDIRGFTPISEQLTPTQLVEQLNQYLTPTVELIQKNQGRLDKFIGDAVMAVWGDLFDKFDTQEEVELAVDTALDLLALSAELNEEWQEEGLPAFKLGVGLHRGEVVFGNLGAEQRMEMTVIGDTVNASARFEGLTKPYGIRLLVGAEVAEPLSDDYYCVLLDRVRVKGKDEATEVYSVLGRWSENEEDLEYEQDVYEGYQLAHETYQEGDFEAAIEKFGEIPEDSKLRGPAELMIDRSEQMLEDPPESWDGVWKMQSK